MSTAAIQLRRKVRVNASLVVLALVIVALTYVIAVAGRGAPPLPTRTQTGAVTTTHVTGPQEPVIVNGNVCHQCFQP